MVNIAFETRPPWLSIEATINNPRATSRSCSAHPCRWSAPHPGQPVVASSGLSDRQGRGRRVPSPCRFGCSRPGRQPGDAPGVASQRLKWQWRRPLPNWGWLTGSDLALVRAVLPGEHSTNAFSRRGTPAFQCPKPPGIRAGGQLAASAQLVLTAKLSGRGLILLVSRWTPANLHSVAHPPPPGLALAPGGPGGWRGGAQSSLRWANQAQAEPSSCFSPTWPTPVLAVPCQLGVTFGHAAERR